MPQVGVHVLCAAPAHARCRKAFHRGHPQFAQPLIVGQQPSAHTSWMMAAALAHQGHSGALIRSYLATHRAAFRLLTVLSPWRRVGPALRAGQAFWACPQARPSDPAGAPGARVPSEHRSAARSAASVPCGWGGRGATRGGYCGEAAENRRACALRSPFGAGGASGRKTGGRRPLSSNPLTLPPLQRGVCRAEARTGAGQALSPPAVASRGHP